MNAPLRIPGFCPHLLAYATARDSVWINHGLQTACGRAASLVSALLAACNLTAAPEPPLYPASVPEPTLSDVRYGEHERNTLDFWKAPATSPTPVVVAIHGGSWMRGSKEKALSIINTNRLLAAGVSVATINYRMIHPRDRTITPPVKAPLEDASRAVQFLRSKAGEWNLDPQRFGAIGASAGAFSSLWLAYHDDLADAASTDPVARESTRLFCVAGVRAQTTLDPLLISRWMPGSSYGAHAFHHGVHCVDPKAFAAFQADRTRLLPWIDEYSPYSQVGPGDPPAFLQYTTPPQMGEMEKDPTHSANFGVRLREKCLENGLVCHLVFPGSDGQSSYKDPEEFFIGMFLPGAKSTSGRE